MATEPTAMPAGQVRIARLTVTRARPSARPRRPSASTTRAAPSQATKAAPATYLVTAKARAASENVNDLANRVIRDVRVAYLNAMTAFERVGLTDQLLKQAELALECSARAGYLTRPIFSSGQYTKTALP